jgi:hypothetical protein
MKNNLLLLSFAIFLVVAFSAQAADISLGNAGFARGGIMFSKDPFFAGDKVRVYTIIFNGSAEDLSGTVEFYDNAKALGRADFTAKGGGTVRDVWTDWTATFGDHNITAKITNAKSSLAGGAARVVTLDVLETGAAQIAVDNDTDKDGIGDKVDPDIDGDGLTNEEEAKYGYDASKKDSNGDGVGDKVDHERQLAKLAVQESALARQAASTTAQLGDKFEAVKEVVGTTTVNAVIRTAKSAAGALETARVAGEKWAATKSATLKTELAADTGGTSSDPSKIKTASKSAEVPNRPFKYAYQLFTLALAFVLASKWLTYLGLSCILYLMLKVLYRWIW